MQLANVQAEYRVSPMAMLVLVLTLLLGTSTALTLVYHFSATAHILEPVVNLGWGLMYLVSLTGLLSMFGVNWLTWLVRYRLLLTLLLAGTAFSAMWSVNAGLTMERTVHLFGSTLIAFYIGFNIPLLRIVATTAKVLSLLVIASIAVVFLYPELGIEKYQGAEVWRGVMTSKNTLGFWAVICVLACAVQAGNTNELLYRVIYAVCILLALLAVGMSMSATSALSLGIAAMFMTYLFVAYRFNLGLVSMFVLGLLCLAVTGIAFLNVDTAELIGRSGDLTGRAQVWEQTWNLIMQQPLTGYGFGTIWFPTDATINIQRSLTDFSWTVYHAHNGALQLASEIGLPLTFLALLMILQQLIEIVYCQYQRQQAGVLFVLGFTVALLVSNYSEARMLVTRELYWIFFVALPISMLQQVSVIVNNTAFNPVPTPLHKRTRHDQDGSASDRKQRRALKQKLQQQLRGKTQGAIIDGETGNSVTGTTDSNRLRNKTVI